MGIADFPIEILHLLKIKPGPPTVSGGQSNSTSDSSDSLKDKESTPSKSETPLIYEDRAVSPGSSNVSLITQNSHVDTTDTNPEPLDPSQEQFRPLSPTSTPDHRRFLGRSLGRSSSRSRSPKRRSSENTSSHHQERHNSASEAAHLSLDAAVGAGKGVGRIVGVGLKSPLDFTLGLARGFHNAPKLYGDESVRQPDKVTDFQSGLKAAGKVGFYKTARESSADQL